MKLIQCRFSSGQRLPLLVQAGDATPLPHTHSVHLRPTLTQVPRLQHGCGASARDPRFLRLCQKPRSECCPLSIRALSNVLDRLFLTIELAHPGLLPTLSAHDFRHTFADAFWLTWSKSVGMTSSGPRTNSGESAVGLRPRLCHAVTQGVI